MWKYGIEILVLYRKFWNTFTKEKTWNNCINDTHLHAIVRL